MLHCLAVEKDAATARTSISANVSHESSRLCRLPSNSLSYGCGRLLRSQPAPEKLPRGARCMAAFWNLDRTTDTSMARVSGLFSQTRFPRGTETSHKWILLMYYPLHSWTAAPSFRHSWHLVLVDGSPVSSMPHKRITSSSHSHCRL